MNTHAENLELYVSSGGDKRLANLYRTSTLQNRSKIIYLLSKISQIKKELKSPMPPVIIHVEKEIIPDKPKFIGEILQYPIELHSTYLEIENLWLLYCRYKLDLNAIPASDEAAALDIQNKIIELFKKFDVLKKILDHYVEHKHILPTESKKDFSNFTALQLDKERRNLESLICRRKQTIKKMSNELPLEEDFMYRKKIAAINHKKEQLQNIILDQEKVNQLIKNLTK